MHEFSMASEIVKTILDEVEKRKVKRVIEVTLVIGEFTFLGLDQIRFCYETLAKGTILEKAKLTIEEQNGIVECDKCSFRGPISYVNEPAFHLQIPSFTCPKCNSEIQIVEGKDCLIKSIKAVV